MANRRDKTGSAEKFVEKRIDFTILVVDRNAVRRPGEDFDTVSDADRFQLVGKSFGLLNGNSLIGCAMEEQNGSLDLFRMV